MVLQCINGVGSNPVEGRTALKSNSNTVWFNFQTYIYIYIYMTINFPRLVQTHTKVSGLNEFYGNTILLWPGYTHYSFILNVQMRNKGPSS